ncbi:TPA_asm: PolB [Dog feces bidnaparvovirus]|nr:TPA_asm: PolB [Dog feces bidnaparvovirus]
MKAPATPCFGYWKFDSADHVKRYAITLAESQSIIIFAHIACQYVDKYNVNHVIHSKTHGSLIFDKEMDDELLSDYLLKVVSQENIKNVEGSGFIVIPGTVQYWVKFAPCQPNPQIDFNKTENHQTKWHNNFNEKAMNTLAIAIVRFIAATKNIKLGLDKSVIQWYKKDLEWDSPHSVRDLQEFHKKYFSDYRIRLFTYYGNVMYNKSFGNTDRVINLGWSSTGKRFYAIFDLQKIMNRKGARYFCDNCCKFHKNSKDCSLQPKFIPAVQPTRELREKPEGKVPFVVYADFEAATHEEFHIISGYAYLFIDASGNVRHQAVYSGENVIREFMSQMAFLVSQYHHVQIFFHNFRGYDSHFLMRELVTAYNPTYFNGKSMEKMNHIKLRFETKDREDDILEFKDTFNFLSSSLASLCNTVDVWKYAPSPEKGIFPYDWFDSVEKLGFPGLPDGPWYNKLTGTFQDHEAAHRRFHELGFKTFRDYHDYYMLLDTQQLADIFENFRTVTHARFGVDPCHFQGSPSLTWFLAMQQQPIHMIQDEEVYLDVSSQIRGGVSQAMLRYMKVDERSDIVFLDINSLYSKCMTYPLPTEYLGKEFAYDPDHSPDHCYFVCVDMEYPDELHDRDWQYPLCPHRFNQRLCTTLLPKQKILLHEETFKFYLSRGMICSRLHYAYKFKQETVLKEYVESNIVERRKTTSEALKSLFKLLNNSLYGKTCENVLNYRNFSALKRNPEIHGTVNSLLADCHVKDFMIFDEDTYLVESEVTEYKLDKPVQMGFAILEFAKLEMYRFIAALQDVYEGDVNFLYTDTDSLIIQTMFPNAFEVFYDHPRIRPFLDFSSLGKDLEREKQSGLWAPETTEKILKYVGLRAKSYAYVTEQKEVTKNKGVPKTATKLDDTAVTFDDYLEVAKKSEHIRTHFHKISSKKHEVQTQLIEKLGLSPFDEKRMLVSDWTISLPFGYRGKIFNDLYFFEH